MIKVDLHNHLGRNGANPGFDETIDIAHKRLGDGGVFGICNDGPIDYRYEDFINQGGGKYERVALGDEKRVIYVPEKQIYVVGVEEAEPVEGSFIAIGMPVGKKIHNKKGRLELEDALKAAEDLDTTRTIVHSFFLDGLGPYLSQHLDLLPHFHGWEVYNASAELWLPKVLPKNANQKAQEFYNSKIRDTYDIGVCSFTDGHSAEVIGRSYTNLSFDLRAKDAGIFIDSLRTAIKGNKDFEALHMRPAKWDAFKHAGHMLMDKAFKVGA